MTVSVVDAATKQNVITQVLGTQLNNGSLAFTDSGDTVIMTSALDATLAFALSGGIGTLNHGGSAVSAGNPLTSTANAGSTATIAKMKIRKSDATVIINMAVATSGSDVNLTSVVFANGEQIVLTGLTIGVV